jgi:hypothetical protein
MDQVKIRAAIAAHGLAKDAEVTVAATPTVEGAIRNGVFVELARIPAEPKDGVDDETPVPPIEEVELPDADVEPEAEDAPKPKGTARRRG